MDATQLLKKDHDKVRALFQQYRGGGGITGLVKRVTGNVSSRERRGALDKVCQELEVHTRIEEQIFYPAVRAKGDPELDKQLDEAFREHATVKEQVAGLRSMRPDDESIDGKVAELEQCVEHHATEEENEMFPRLQELMSDIERAELGRRLQAAKRARAAHGTTRARATARSTKTATRTTARGRKTSTARQDAKATVGAGRKSARRTRPVSKAKKVKRPKRAHPGRSR